MKATKDLYRKFRLSAKRDVLLSAFNVLAKVYAVGFTIYLPSSRVLSLPAPQGRLWLGFYFLSLAAAAIIPFLPKATRAKWAAVQRTRTEATNVAISSLAACVRASQCSPVQFQDITRRLLTAMRQEIEQFIADTEGIYINVSLLAQDDARPDFLRVLNRANDDRPLSVYPKGDLSVWHAMKECRVIYVPRYTDPTKEYSSILALPILLEDELGNQESIGVVSIDSGRPQEFDDQVDELRLRMLPYLSLLKLALSVRRQYGGMDAASDSDGSRQRA